jgi:hypothetical protein
VFARPAKITALHRIVPASNAGVSCLAKPAFVHPFARYANGASKNKTVEKVPA